MDQPEGSVLAASFATRAEAEACVGRLRLAGFHPSCAPDSTAVYVPGHEAPAAGAFLDRRAKATSRARRPVGRGLAALAVAVVVVIVGFILLVRMLEYLDALRSH